VTALIVRTLPGGPRNGLPVRTGNYRYQGTGSDVLTAWMDDPRHRPLCGRLMTGGQLCGRRKGHGDHCKSEEAVASDRAAANERSRKSRRSRQRRAA
jgi:hypothetical protein